MASLARALWRAFAPGACRCGARRFDDVAYADIAVLKPMEQYAALPLLGKAQILSTIG
jgi:hypothetical protein